MGLRRPFRSDNPKRAALASLFVAANLLGCSGDKPGDAGTGGGPVPCSGFCQTADPQRLAVVDVERVIAQAVQEAGARSAPAVIAVVDRVGNVLGVYRMDGAPDAVRVGSPAAVGPIDGGLEGVSLVPSSMSAIAKAVTGAYLSSEGNAFSTRTASQIVQAHFDPEEFGQPGGPLSGVQFSQLPCSDLATRFAPGAGPGPGPHRSPLGLSADPGGFPLYKNGTVVGGVGIEADGAYTFDESIRDRDQDVDELIAMAATFGFAAPRDRRADVITVDGKTLRFSDVDFGDLAEEPSAAPAFASLAGGGLVAVNGYTDATPVIVEGTAFAQPESGVAAGTDADFAARDAFLLVDAANANRYPAIAGTDAGLTAAEVRALLLSALDVANRERAQIRQPLGSQARVSISVVDTNGAVVGFARTRDAPVFGTDVSLQKARTAMLFSSAGAAAAIAALPPAGYLEPDNSTPTELRRVDLGDYVTALQDFIDVPAALTDGGIAFADRTVGNLARPFYPDGVVNRPAGPLAKPAGEWSPFSDGLQLDLGYNAIIRHVAFVAGLPVPDVPQNCTGVQPLNDGLGVSGAIPQAANGIQIFPGGVPIYRGDQLIGGIGISGDGIEQDDMVAFLGLHNAGLAGGAIGNAPKEIRADRLNVGGVNLRYIQCPQAPFLDSDEQNACAGL
jgi:uncharacterized protein GlcG (DUF336 family)